jgi:(p)ppGpp synthase/HD superfamily hydrolase
MHWNPDGYARAWLFATRAHAGQTYGGPLDGEQLPYISHIAEVAAEVMGALTQEEGLNGDLAVQCALLHDTVEDTDVTLEQVEQQFGAAVAAGVAALSKDASLPTKDARMADSLERIRAQPREVWMVKLADRIVNLSQPPFYWTEEKARHYRAEAKTIHEALHEAHAGLAQRLLDKIEAYRAYTGE